MDEIVVLQVVREVIANTAVLREIAYLRKKYVMDMMIVTMEKMKCSASVLNLPQQV